MTEKMYMLIDQLERSGDWDEIDKLIEEIGEQAEKEKKMEHTKGTRRVWLKHERRTVHRVIYTDGSKYYIPWYGESRYKEVEFDKKGRGWKTID